MTILVVDDYEDVRTALRYFFRDLSQDLHIGIEVLMAKDGKEAVLIIQEHPGIDIVVTDLTMPNMNGVELAAWVKANTQIPVILQSAHNDPKSQADIFVSKTGRDSSEKLISAIRELCKV